VDIQTGEFKSLVGTTLDSRYQILELIGQGGMSTVYKAHHLFLDRDVAIKIMQDHMASQNEGQARFQREGKAAAALSHPNIVAVTEFGVFEGQPYMVMDYLQGLSLAEYLKQKGRPNPALALKIFKQAASALQHAHEKGIVHRDLKPSNVMLVRAPGDNSITCKVVDFGLARFIPRAGEQAHRLTAAGELVGSPFYMSPEQIRDEELDARSDIYSFGCLMYETLTGVRPFLDTNAITVLSMHLYESPPPFGIVLQPNRLPPRIESVVMKCMEKSRSNRFQSMRELVQQLDGIPEWEDGPSKSIPFNPNVDKPSVPSGSIDSAAEIRALDPANTQNLQHMTLRLKRPTDKRVQHALKTAIKAARKWLIKKFQRLKQSFEGKGPNARRKKVSGTRVLVAVLGDTKELIDAADLDYNKYAVYFKNVERRRSMNAQEFLVLLSSEMFDIIHLHGRFDKRAVFEDSTGFQLRVSDVRRACDFSKVKLLWLASDNSLHYLRDNPVLTEPPFHFILTSSRGENFPKFLSSLLARIARGEPVVSAWNSYVPRAQYQGDRTNCRLIHGPADTSFLP
jgi:serine/threonine protein kinase